MLDAALREIALLLADGQPDHPGAVGLRDIFGKAAPAAADLQQLLAGLQVDRLGQPAIFVVLRGGQINRVVLEQRRGIGHAGVEPGRVKRIADVVMGIDVAPRLPPGVAIEPVADALDKAQQRLVAHHGLDQFMIDAEQIEELGQIGRVPFAMQIGFGDADVAAIEQPRRKAVIVQRHRCRRARLGAAHPDLAAVGEGDLQGAAAKFRTEAERQPDQAWQIRKQRLNIVGGQADHVRHGQVH